MNTSFLNNRQLKLLVFVKEQHGDQTRKYTGEPYWYHLVAVAEGVGKYEPLGIERALCHDLFEDTNCTDSLLRELLLLAGYSLFEAHEIYAGIIELTDYFTPERFPHLNRAQRKTKESERLGTISYLSQSVKYADLVNNTESIVKYDPHFAKKYLQEKIAILDKMRNGNINLLIDCCHVLKNALTELHPLL